MKTKLIIVSIFFALLSILCIYELTFCQNSLTEISENSKNIINQIENEIESNLILENLEKAYDNWKNKEYSLCLTYNHKDLLEIGKEINQAISYIKKDNIDEAYVHMLLLEEDLRALNQIVNFDLTNIF